jgi:hypothetical protein
MTAQDNDASLLPCPYCGELVDVAAEDIGAQVEDYVEDCPVCCRPWNVHVTRTEDGVAIELRRDDE